MRTARWGAAAAAALTICVPAVAEAATPSSTGTAPTPGTSARQAITSAAGALQPTATSAPSTSTAPATSSQQVKSQDTTVTQPAPAGSADAYAAKVGDIAAVSHTSASASGSGGSATADPLELGGSNPPSSQFGGTQSGDGTKSGSLFDTQSTPLGRLALTPWTASASSSGSGNSASGLADIVLLDLGDPSSQQSASLRVLQSRSDATWNSQESTGSSSSDGAILDVGGPSGLAVDVLHSETSSSGAGSSYLLSVTGNQIGSSSQANGQCSLTLPSVLALECLTASGGTGANGVLTSTAGVVSAAVGPTGSGLTAGLIQAASTSGKAPAAAPAVTPAVSSPAASSPAAAPAASAPAASAPAAAAPAASSSLPFTGANIGLLVAAALALASAGAALVAASRRYRPAVVASR